jgi:putative membrane protein
MLLNKRIPIYYIFNKVKIELIFVVLIGLLVYFVTNKYGSFFPIMPLTIPAFLGTAISILLSFQLNQSYERWWEARRLWGSIVNNSRSLVLQLQTLIDKGNETLIKKIAYRQIAWCYAFGQTLRGQNPTDNIENFLSADELNIMKLHTNKQLALLQFHALDISKLKEDNQLDRLSHIQIDNTLVRLCDAMGGSERIKSTVYPVTYRIFLHLIIYLFVITLSISLKDVIIYFELPLLIVISAAFFLLQKTATYMQDPFNNQPTDTPVTAIARNIEINIRQLLHEMHVPEPLKPSDFYIL